MRTVLIITLILFLWQILIIYGARSGPFKTTYIRVAPCPTLTPPVDQDPPSYFYGELYNTTSDFNLMRGNITVVRDHRIKKMKAKSYIWENSKWKVNYLINNMGCNRVFFPVLSSAIGIKYDTNTCTFYEGVYTYDNFNINKIQHTWMASQEYGRVLWRMEVATKTGTAFCYDYETLIEPVK